MGIAALNPSYVLNHAWYAYKSLFIAATKLSGKHDSIWKPLTLATRYSAN